MLAAKTTSVNAVAARSSRSVVTKAASRPTWLPGSTPPAHLDGTMPGDFGWDPLGLGAEAERLSWFAEAERVHCRWAMAGTAGILAQEIVRPDVFWYNAGNQPQEGIPILGLVAIQFVCMHYTEVRRWQDWRKPGSVSVDPLFPNNNIGQTEVGYPGLKLFVPGSMEEMKLKEIKNGRISMLAFLGFTMQAQVTGKGPLACLSEHLADPLGTTIFSKAVVIPQQTIAPTCQIPESIQYEGITIPTPCMLSAFWP